MYILTVNRNDSLQIPKEAEQAFNSSVHETLLSFTFTTLEAVAQAAYAFTHDGFEGVRYWEVRPKR